jgi:hypothetical protein
VVDHPVKKIKNNNNNNKIRSKDSEKDQRGKREKRVLAFWGEEREREMVLIITKIDDSDFSWEINRRDVVKLWGIMRIDDMAWKKKNSRRFGKNRP